MPKITPALPLDRRATQGGWIFLGSLFVFFLTSILFYGLYAYWRRADPATAGPLPQAFLISTLCLLCISAVVHAATRAVRRDRHLQTAALLASSCVLATGFMVIQGYAMWLLLEAPENRSGLATGVSGMVVVLAFLHALHVAGGVMALGIVSTRSALGKYDHERFWAVDFAAHYWHFLDAVWLCMLLAFWLTTGGF